ncbi:Spy/CpxP family protein refolding chaperone [Nitratifractor sp.]
MKKGIIATTAALGLAGMLYAGNGMGPGNGRGNCGNCGNGGPQMGQNGGQGCAQEMHRGQGKQGAMHGRHGKRGMHAPMMKKVFSQLNLSDEQKQQIRQIMRESRQQKGMKGQGMRGQGMGMQGQGMKGQGMKGQRRGRLGLDASAFMNKENFDKEAFKKALQQKWEQQDKMRQQRRAQRLERMADRMEKIFKVLSPEQRQKLIELSKQK